jgi:catechol 2,3-dioxygenase-like lactoylglutathione lyase family enzyme
MIKTVWGITFYVSDLKKATKFYEEIVCLEKKYEFSSYVGFECGGVEVGLIPKPDEIPVARGATPSIELLVDDVESFCDKLKKKGVRFVKELHAEAWGGRQATFTDPDGNVLEIAQIDWEKYFRVSAEGAKKKSGAE